MDKMNTYLFKEGVKLTKRMEVVDDVISDIQSGTKEFDEDFCEFPAPEDFELIKDLSRKIDNIILDFDEEDHEECDECYEFNKNVDEELTSLLNHLDDCVMDMENIFINWQE